MIYEGMTNGKKNRVNNCLRKNDLNDLMEK